MVHAHYISRLIYGSVLWNKSVTSKEIKKLGVNLNRVLRLLCKDYADRLSNYDLNTKSDIHSVPLLRAVADSTMLFKLCTGMVVEPLCERLKSKCVVSQQLPKKLQFFEYSRIRIGRNSFMNWAKYICESITFDWADMSFPAFKAKLRLSTPILWANPKIKEDFVSNYMIIYLKLC